MVSNCETAKEVVGKPRRKVMASMRELRKWKPMFEILHITRDMTAKEVHEEVTKNGSEISRGTVHRWKRIAAEGGWVAAKFETMQEVLLGLGYTMTIVAIEKATVASGKRVNKFRTDEKSESHQQR
jgi:hypothetical protein